MTVQEVSPRELSPTDVTELRAVLDALVQRTTDALPDGLVGVYLVGSFALGAGDAHSDVDFLVITTDPPDEPAEARLRAVHAELPDLDSHWAQHLEGSYVSAAEIRTMDEPAGRWLYVDNGSRQLEWSSHDNNAHSRWVLRGHGVALTGPKPESLVDEVPVDVLRQEATDRLRTWSDTFRADPHLIDGALAQTSHVVAVCRAMFTAAESRVTSKRLAAQWALRTVDYRWADLIRQAIADRPDPWTRVHQPADPALVADTLAFGDYAADFADRATRA